MHKFDQVQGSCKQDMGLSYKEGGAILRKESLIGIQGPGPGHGDQNVLQKFSYERILSPDKGLPRPQKSVQT